MGDRSGKLHIFFFPFIFQGHLIPAVDMAKLFASRGVKATIICIPLYHPLISKSIAKTKQLGFEIHTLIINFPCELESVELSTLEMLAQFFKATAILEQPLEQLMRDHRPDCLVAVMFFPWATQVASKFSIPRIVFHGTCFFSLCAAEIMRLHEPHKKVSSDSELFVIPNFPDEIQLTRNQIPNYTHPYIDKLLKEGRESELTSYGVVVNSFCELEPAYADHFRKNLGRKAWHIGPVSLCNKDNEDKARRGKEAAIGEHQCLQWLHSKKPNSVVYLCFGSRAKFTATQLMEIAMGLEASGLQFIWVVTRKHKNHHDDQQEEKEKWLPQGFEKRMEGKGLIIRGWAPQVVIVDHEAVGGFVTHCGWNSTLEAVSAGVPMVTWPLSAEQFYNEKLVTQVVKIWVSVGVKRWVRVVGDFVGREAVEMALRRIMEGEAAEGMRRRAREVGEMARRAVEEGGSSDSDLNALLRELRFHCLPHAET